MSNMNWDVLNKASITFGIASGIVLVFSVVKWIYKRTKTSKIINLIAWSITGDEDRDSLMRTIKAGSRLFFAAIVWAIIGAIIGLLVPVLFTLVSIAFGTQVYNAESSFSSYMLLGAIIGVFFRLIIWPITEMILAYFRRRNSERKARLAEFENKEHEVEKAIRKAKSNDKN